MKCKHCGFTNHVKGAEWCQECGAKLLFMYCENPNCPSDGKILLPDDAIYCPYCGEEISARYGED